jgi:hypothetical protein
MVPRLIEVLRQASADARAGNKPNGSAFFALFLLAEFQAKEALPAILDAVTLPGDLPFDLFGDAITSVLARILVALADDLPEVMDALIRNREVNEYVRWEAAQGYLLLVRDGRMSRDEAVQRLHQHLREAIDGDDYAIAGPLVSELAWFAPKEALADIEEGYRRGLVEPFLIGLEDIERSIAEGEAYLRKALDHCGPTGIEDTIGELEHWAAFRQEPPPRSPPSLPPTARPSQREPIAPSQPAEASSTVKSSTRRVGRNEPCPCGSGKKYKKCCGHNE